MKVAMVTRDFPPRASGISTYTSELVRHLRELGIEVDTFVGGSDVGTVALTIQKTFSGYDLVHVQSAPYGFFVRRRPLVVTVHETVLAELRFYTKAQVLKSIPAIFLERATLRRADAIVAVSEAAKSEVVDGHGVPAHRIRVVPNGVEPVAPPRPKHPRGGPLKVLVVSRLEPRKNVGDALEALSALAPGAYTLDVAGGGSERDRLEARAKALGLNVSFHGVVSGDALKALYAGADIFISASRSEGFGLALLEAASAGCALAASDIPAHRRLLEGSGSAELFKSVEGLTSIMQRLVASREEVRFMGEKGRVFASKYTWEESAKSMMNVYEEALGSQARA